MQINWILTAFWWAILTLFFYAASKAGFKKEATAIIALGELIPVLHMYVIALSYYNAAVEGQLSTPGLISFITWFAYTVYENAIEDVFANIGALIATFILKFVEEISTLM